MRSHWTRYVRDERGQVIISITVSASNEIVVTFATTRLTPGQSIEFGRHLISAGQVASYDPGPKDLYGLQQAKDENTRVIEEAFEISRDDVGSYVAHDWNMPHNFRDPNHTVCPPNCPANQ